MFGRAFGKNDHDGFVNEMKDFFSKLGQYLTVESNVIMPTQVCSKMLHFTYFA